MPPRRIRTADDNVLTVRHEIIGPDGEPGDPAVIAVYDDNPERGPLFVLTPAQAKRLARALMWSR